MWYLIGVVLIALIGFFVYANRKSKRCCCGSKESDKPTFRTEEDINTYNKPLDDKKSHVDFDDAE